MTVKGGTSPACAVCKFQRRKCKPDCALAPHFPANQSKAFQNVHRLFGVSNIMKILQQLNSEEQKEEAMKSIKYESDMRQRYPVYGCAGIICQLRQQLSESVEELNDVYAQLSVFRQQLNNNNNNNNMNMNAQGMQPVPTSSYLQVGQSSHHPPEPADTFMMNQFLGTNEYDAFLEPNYLSKDSDGFEPNYYDVINADNNLMDNQPHHIFNSNVVEERGKQIYEADEDSEFNTFSDDRQSYIHTKDVCQSSSDSFSQVASKVDQACDNDLKNAAARFSLTNINHI